MKYRAALVLVLVGILTWFVWSNVGRSEEQDLLLCEDALLRRRAAYNNPNTISIANLEQTERDIERYCDAGELAQTQLTRITPTPTPIQDIFGFRKKTPTP